MNTGKDHGRFPGDTRNIQNTYDTIGNRFSGLMAEEGSRDLRSQYPFQTCQRTGSMAPISKTGNVNRDAVSLANTKGGIQGIQDFYNTIFNLANTPASADRAAEQATAIKQCYGINKALPPPPPAPKTKRVISPGYGYREGWGNQAMLTGGLRSQLKTGDKVVLKLTSLSIAALPDKKSNPTYTPPQDRVYYLKYDPFENQGAFVTFDDYEDETCIHTIVFAENNAQFQTFANQNHRGIQPDQNLFALKNNNGMFLTISDRAAIYAEGMWPNNQPGPMQMFNWNDVSDYSMPKYPFGPFCPGAWGVLIRAPNGYASLYGNYGVQQLMEILAV
jgi:hypothetical protein